MVSYVLWGGAALHPSMPQLGAPTPAREYVLLTPTRLALLTGASLIAPLISALHHVHDRELAFLVVDARLDRALRPRDRPDGRPRAPAARARRGAAPPPRRGALRRARAARDRPADGAPAGRRRSPTPARPWTASSAPTRRASFLISEDRMRVARGDRRPRTSGQEVAPFECTLIDIHDQQRVFEVHLTNLIDEEHVGGILRQRARRHRAQGVRGPAHAPGVPRHGHRARQPRAVRRAGPRRDRPRAADGRLARGRVRRPGRLQDDQRLARPRRRRRGPDRGRAPPRRRGARRGRRGALRRRRVRRPARGRGQPGGRGRRAAHPRRAQRPGRSGRARWWRCAPASASPSRWPTTTAPPRSCCATRTRPCTSPSATARAATACSSRRCTRASSPGSSCAPTCAGRSTRASWSCSTSRSCACRTARRPASRR